MRNIPQTITCSRCGEECCFSQNAYGRCRCVREFWAADGAEQLAKYQVLKQLAEEGNPSAIANICDAQEHLKLEIDEYENWVKIAADLRQVGAVEAYLDLIVYGDPFEYSSESEKKLEHYCSILEELSSGSGNYYRFQFYENAEEFDKARDFLLEGAKQGNYECIQEIFEEQPDDEFGDAVLRNLALSNLASGRVEAAYFLGLRYQEQSPEDSLVWLKMAYETARDFAIGKPDDISTVYWSDQVEQVAHFADCEISKDDLLSNLGDTYYFCKRFEEALKTYYLLVETLKLDGFADDRFGSIEYALFCLNKLGLIASERDDFDLAERYWSEGAKYKSTYCINNMGWLSRKRGLVSAAEHWFSMLAVEGNEYAIKGMIWVCQQRQDVNGAELWQKKLDEISRGTNRDIRTTGPAPRLIKSWNDAELVACEWIRFFGFNDAQVTAAGADGGIDVVSGKAVAQVKMEGIATSRPVVQALYGVAVAEGKEAFFFSLSGYTKDALDWGEKVGMALFEFDYQGVPTARTSSASKYL